MLYVSFWKNANIDGNNDVFQGWNYIVFSTTAFQTNGSPNWNTIDGVKFKFTEAVSQDTTLIVDGLRAFKTATSTGVDGSMGIETITATAIPFNQYSLTDNKLKFLIKNKKNRAGISEAYIVKTSSETQLFAAIKLLSSEGLDPAFKLGEIYSFPNPAKGGVNPIIHVETGIADKVEIILYDISGELVDLYNVDGARYKVLNNKYCYEEELDMEDKASGVYIYVVKTSKEGYSPLKVVKKLALIK